VLWPRHFANSLCGAIPRCYGPTSSRSRHWGSSGEPQVPIPCPTGVHTPHGHMSQDRAEPSEGSKWTGRPDAKTGQPAPFAAGTKPGSISYTHYNANPRRLSRTPVAGVRQRFLGGRGPRDLGQEFAVVGSIWRIHGHNLDDHIRGLMNASGLQKRLSQGVQLADRLRRSANAMELRR
jgi:hypothetical protein